MRRLDVRDPVAQGLADGVLERPRTTVDRPDLRTEGPHPEHVRRLPGDVLDAHVDYAGDLQECAGSGRSHAVHACAGLGNNAALAEAPRQQNLAEGVVELVSAGMVQVLALEVEPETVGQSFGRRARSLGLDTGHRQDLRSQPIGSIHRRWPAAVVKL